METNENSLQIGKALLVSVINQDTQRPQTIVFSSYETFEEFRKSQKSELVQFTVMSVPYYSANIPSD